MYFDQIDEWRRNAIYMRISTAMQQKTDRQVEELVAFTMTKGDQKYALLSIS